MRISDWSSDVCSSDLLKFQQLRGISRELDGRSVGPGGCKPFQRLWREVRRLGVPVIFNQLSLFVGEIDDHVTARLQVVVNLHAIDDDRLVRKRDRMRLGGAPELVALVVEDRKSTRLNSSH